MLSVIAALLNLVVGLLDRRASRWKPLGRPATCQDWIGPPMGSCSPHSGSSTRSPKRSRPSRLLSAAPSASSREAEPDEIIRSLGVYLKGIDPKALTELPGLMRTEIPSSIGFSRSSFEAALAFHRMTGLVKHLPTYEQIVPAALRTDAT
ncbi:hypothetical protein AB0K12_36030 [Nonomuraea sp. NPDC049419]|uniref:hypothetical protein n=1 Tax=Nonomuraea sp. NPDC049419 TaxID=3155772 RepID=UPI0034243DF9